MRFLPFVFSALVSVSLLCSPASAQYNPYGRTVSRPAQNRDYDGQTPMPNQRRRPNGPSDDDTGVTTMLHQRTIGVQRTVDPSMYRRRQRESASVQTQAAGVAINNKQMQKEFNQLPGREQVTQNIMNKMGGVQSGSVKKTFRRPGESVEAYTQREMASFLTPSQQAAIKNAKEAAQALSKVAEQVGALKSAIKQPSPSSVRNPTGLDFVDEPKKVFAAAKLDDATVMKTHELIQKHYDPAQWTADQKGAAADRLTAAQLTPEYVRQHGILVTKDGKYFPLQDGIEYSKKVNIRPEHLFEQVRDSMREPAAQQLREQLTTRNNERLERYAKALESLHQDAETAAKNIKAETNAGQQSLVNGNTPNALITDFRQSGSFDLGGKLTGKVNAGSDPVARAAIREMKGKAKDAQYLHQKERENFKLSMNEAEFKAQTAHMSEPQRQQLRANMLKQEGLNERIRVLSDRSKQIKTKLTNDDQCVRSIKDPSILDAIEFEFVEDMAKRPNRGERVKQELGDQFQKMIKEQQRDVAMLKDLKQAWLTDNQNTPIVKLESGYTGYPSYMLKSEYEKITGLKPGIANQRPSKQEVSEAVTRIASDIWGREYERRSTRSDLIQKQMQSATNEVKQLQTELEQKQRDFDRPVTNVVRTVESIVNRNPRAAVNREAELNDALDSAAEQSTSTVAHSHRRASSTVNVEVVIN